MQTGWVKVNNNWYYMDPSSGRMVTGTIIINGISYTMNNSGVWVK
jgi:glucan-binding YG repeat protein